MENLGLFSKGNILIGEKLLVWSYVLLMALLGALIMIAWGNLFRNYILRWVIAMTVYYMPTNKEINLTEMAILEFLSDGLTVRVRGTIDQTALFIPTTIQVSIKEIFIFALNITIHTNSI